MKKVIDGKLYNTRTAKYICDTGNTIRESDFEWERSALYITKKGRFFISGEGGALSRFATKSGNHRTTGSGLFPLTQGEALQLCRKHGEPEDLQEFFKDAVVNA